MTGDDKQETENKLRKIERQISYMQQVISSKDKKYQQEVKESAIKTLPGLLKEQEDLLRLLGR